MYNIYGKCIQKIMYKYKCKWVNPIFKFHYAYLSCVNIRMTLTDSIIKFLYSTNGWRFYAMAKDISFIWFSNRPHNLADCISWYKLFILEFSMTIESFPLNSDSTEFRAWDYISFCGFILKFSETSSREFAKPNDKIALSNGFTK